MGTGMIEFWSEVVGQLWIVCVVLGLVLSIIIPSVFKRVSEVIKWWREKRRRLDDVNSQYETLCKTRQSFVAHYFWARERRDAIEAVSDGGGVLIEAASLRLVN
eukprot:GHVN01101812.1.p1 GENE.GHVN01101812.1~~GHVN01101812.1.p1  ORF type:complete len:104 (+),score=29.98 GHVN01101812.1:36-347(+)